MYYIHLCSYLAPEYFMYGKVNDKIDVYAFGVVLLELLSGRKPISPDYPKGQESLVMWVCFCSPMLWHLLAYLFPNHMYCENYNRNTLLQATPILNSGKVLQLLDPSLGENYDHGEMEKMVLAATLCIKRAPRARPQMSLVSGPLLTLLQIVCTMSSNNRRLCCIWSVISWTMDGLFAFCLS